MNQPPYSRHLRLLTCAGCGAPLEAEFQGGVVRCQYCGADSVFGPRAEAPGSNRATDLSESERLARLREQEAQGERFPDGLNHFVIEGALNVSLLEDAKSEWLRARASVTQDPAAFPMAERLFYMTALLVPHVDEREGRAMLETATDLLSDERHRHVLRCTVARLAADAAEVEDARGWLELCDPRPLDLPMDTAYRYASSSIATAERAFDRVLGVLGTDPGDVPLGEREALGCELLRANALAELGRDGAAVAALQRLAQEAGASRVDGALRKGPQLQAGTRCWTVALRQDQDSIRQELRRLRFAWVGAIVPVAISVGFMLLLTALQGTLDSPGSLALGTGLGVALGLYLFYAAGKERREKVRELRERDNKLSALIVSASDQAQHASRDQGAPS